MNVETSIQRVKRQKIREERKMSKKQNLKISLMLFSMFFGAGNLIFPPMVGKMAGTNMWITMAAFAFTAVLLPVLGVSVVSETKGLQNLASRVDPVFAMVFTVLIYLSIGPMLGLPRAGSLPFEMAVSPYLPESVNKTMALFVYTLIFFGAAFILSLNPGKLVERMGKVLTPILLVLIALLFISSFFKTMPVAEAPVKTYGKTPFVQGFLDGYNTLDAVAALNFGFVVYITINGMGVKDDKKIAALTKKSGIIAGSLLLIIYLSLANLGAKSASMFPNTENGASILSNVSIYLLGGKGAVLLGLIFTLACLTTSIGLITSCSAYFTELFKNKLSYKTWVFIWCFISLGLANFGLNRILGYSVMVLNSIYPISIVLIFMAILNRYVKLDKLVYRATIYTTAVVSVLDVAASTFGFVKHLVSFMPFSDMHMEWVIPAVVVFGLSLAFSKLSNKLSPIPEA